MPAYMIFTRERMRDTVTFAEYESGAGGTLAGHEVKPLAIYGASQTLEGPEVDGAVLLEFPTVEAARAWYDSPAYREVRRHRQLGADYRVFITAGL